MVLEHGGALVELSVIARTPASHISPEAMTVLSIQGCVTVVHMHERTRSVGAKDKYGPTTGRAKHGRFNAFIIRATEAMYQSYGGKGYDINSYFTHNLDYGPSKGVIKSNHPPKTMCVAAVSEVIIAALNLYYADTSDEAPFRVLPYTSWNGSQPTDIRPYMFMHDGTGSSGTASALTKFSIGAELPFQDLLPGDFINFDRASGSGHAVVFLGFINASGDILDHYSSDVVGFKYFSAQGKGKPDAGLGYRWGYFDGFCPQPRPNQPRDCGIVKAPNQKSFNSGCIFHPTDWELASDKVVASFLISQVTVVVARELTAEEKHELGRPDSAFHLFAMKELAGAFGKPLPASKLSRFDGITTD